MVVTNTDTGTPGPGEQDSTHRLTSSAKATEAAIVAIGDVEDPSRRGRSE